MSAVARLASSKPAGSIVAAVAGPPPAAGAQPADLRPLTALRFFAAMWVVLYHYWPNLDAAHTPAVVAKGYLGVELFFTLSGFILCHVYLAAVGDGRFRYGAFLWARLARIYPLHLLTLIAVGAMAGAALAVGQPVDANVLSWSSLPANLLLVHAWGLAPAAGWNHPSWSISAEWFAYLSFPGFAWAALALRSRPRVALAGALSLLGALYVGFPAVTGTPLTHATIAWGAIRIIPCFIYGCAIYLVWRTSALRTRNQAMKGAFFSGAVVTLAALAGGPDLLIVAAFGPMILSFANLSNTQTYSNVGNIFVYLGEASYSIYMLSLPWQLLFVHTVTMGGAQDKSHLSVYVWIVMTITVIPLALLSYNIAERPARALMRRWGRPLQSGESSVAQRSR